MSRKYLVTLTEKEIYSVEVKAESEDEAIEMAIELVDTDKGRTMYHDGSDGDAEAWLIAS